jgi:chemotaxis protein CheX
MSLELEARVLREDLVRIVKDIFATMLAMEVGVEDAPGPREAPAVVVTASMHLGGAWSGAVLLQCSQAAACEFTAVMLGAGKPETATDDVKDVMGEMINMVAGNFKAALGGGAHLSLPTVVEGADYRFRILRGHETASVAFQTPAGAVYVSLIEIPDPEAGK